LDCGIGILLDFDGVLAECDVGPSLALNSVALGLLDALRCVAL
jgi:hypothetical protein